ncbi:MAG: hypothetical protein ACK46J_09445 [Burkholderiales bacterium]|jgi:hypothetical protein|nr:hypothetical protein [Betaproteobacteria bacterium]
MTRDEVERILGYTPCVCGVIDGTWHPECYRGLTDAEITAGYTKAFAAAKRHIKNQQANETNRAIFKAMKP